MKPYVICHMCTTIDGRILTDRWPRLAGRKSAASLFESTADRFGIGAWLVGTTTMREFAGREVKLPPAGRRIGRGDHLAVRRARRFAIGADAKGKLRFEKADVEGDHVVLLVSARVSQAYLAHLQRAGVSYLFCGGDHVDLKVALDKLRRVLGIRRLMLEGGGTFNGAMLRDGLVDEISQIVVPVVDGGRGIPSLFDIPGDPPRKAAAALRLKSQRTLPGGVRWLRYRVAGRKP
ncbi:MAG TPA: RibD family protein [Myxococcales bacterium]|nr:RibD family protein [Myxococcales bacterium]